MNSEVTKECINLFEKFLTDIIKSFPEYKSPIYNSYENIMVRDNTKNDIKEYPEIISFLKKINAVEKLITDKNEEIFVKDISLIEGISFKKVWSSNISEKTKKKIWKYLQTFSMISITYHSNENLLNVLGNMNDEDTKEKPKLKKEEKEKIESLKKLSQDVSKTESNGLFDGLDDIPGMDMLLNSTIGKVATDIANDINMDEVIGNIDENADPMEMMTNIMQNGNIGKVFSSIHEKVGSKIESGELSQENLVNEAQGFYKDMENNPLFSSMMNMMNPQNMQPTENKSSENKSSENKSSEKK
tara:strand:+ start:374 stop:1276 length:903 start_codon:yes stop_codon:yes gene_type:complete